MRRKWYALFCAALLAVVCGAPLVHATAANTGYTTVFIVKGATFSPFMVLNQASHEDLPAGFDGQHWLSLQKTEGPSDVYVVNNSWKPINFDGNNGIASTGWHTHPGHSLIVVTAGTLTEYEGDDCTRHTYMVGVTFVDPGDGHVHIVRNEGNVTASTIAIQIVPSDPNKANRRIDAPAPVACTYIQ